MGASSPYSVVSEPGFWLWAQGGVGIAVAGGAMAAVKIGGAIFGGSDAPARWVFADASGPLGQSMYRANAARWNSGTLDAIAVELGRQRGRDARRERTLT